MNVPLSVRGLRAGYGPVEVLHGIDLDVAPGCITAIVGRNGAGKSTLLSCLAGVHPIDAGRVRLLGTDVAKLPAYRRAQRGILHIPDRGAVFAGLTVEQNLQLFAGDSSVDPALAAFPALERHFRQMAGTLSGGEQQMLALSRALLRPFTVLLVDELSRGLAAQIVAELYAKLAQLAESGAAIAVVEHHQQAVRDLARFMYALNRGRVVFGGEPADLAATST